MAALAVKTLSALPFGMLNAFLIRVNEGTVLIDTGLPGFERQVIAELKRLGLSLQALRLIVLTHGHIDHAGSAAALRRLTGAPILLHAAEAPFCAGQATYAFRPTRPFGHLFKATGLIQKPYEAFVPDCVVEGEGPFNLAPYGLAAEALWTPGHTAGSLSVLCGDGTVFAGDLAASGLLLGGIALRGRPMRPPFEEEPRRVAASLDQLLARGGRRFFLGHGGPLDREAIARHSARLKRL